MALINLQRGIAESGRIRIGQQVPTSGGRSRPAKLETFRLTSADRRRIEQAAEAYGGKVEEWLAPAGKQWQVITTTDELDVVVPPSDLSFSQHYELWSAGGCQRRCDGVAEQLSQGPCICDPAARECDIHTRLSVMLRDLPGLGVWRLDTQGYYAAVELAGAVEIIGLAAGRGALLPARLRLEQRSVKRPDDKGKPQTRRFAVPVLDIEVSPRQLLAAGAQPIALLEAATERPPLTPVLALPPGTGQTVAEQSAPPAAPPRRRNSAPELLASGRQRASADAADAEPITAEAVAEMTGGEVVAIQQPEQEAIPNAPAPASTVQPEPAAARPDQAPRRRRGPGCTHPLDRREGGTCTKCGEVLEVEEQAAETQPTARARGASARSDEGEAEDSSAREPKQPGDAGYWLARLHAVAAERGIDHDGLRLIGAAIKRTPPDELEAFSMKDLSDEALEGLDRLFRALPEGLDVEKATLWVWPIAERRGLDSWESIDAVATAALPVSLDEATPAHWIAFGLRLHAGEYDAAEEPEPTKPAARPRGAK